MNGKIKIEAVGCSYNCKLQAFMAVHLSLLTTITELWEFTRLERRQPLIYGRLCKVFLILVVVRSKASVYGRLLAETAGSNLVGDMSICLLWVSVCCHVEVSANSQWLVQSSPTECGVSECDRGISQRRSRTSMAVEPCNKKKFQLLEVYIGTEQ
jgi:hypothetical protein